MTKFNNPNINVEVAKCIPGGGGVYFYLPPALKSRTWKSHGQCLCLSSSGNSVVPSVGEFVATASLFSSKWRDFHSYHYILEIHFPWRDYCSVVKIRRWWRSVRIQYKNTDMHALFPRSSISPNCLAGFRFSILEICVLCLLSQLFLALTSANMFVNPFTEILWVKTNARTPLESLDFRKMVYLGLKFNK